MMHHTTPPQSPHNALHSPSIVHVLYYPCLNGSTIDLFHFRGIVGKLAVRCGLLTLSPSLPPGMTPSENGLHLHNLFVRGSSTVKCVSGDLQVLSSRSTSVWITSSTYPPCVTAKVTPTGAAVTRSPCGYQSIELVCIDSTLSYILHSQ